MPPTLPKLTSTPTRYAGCCASLSEPLLATIRSLLPDPVSTHPGLIPGKQKQQQQEDVTSFSPPSSSLPSELALGPDLQQNSTSAPPPSLLLSIGSGTGLLEELLHQYLSPPSSSHPTKPLSPPPTRRAQHSWRVEGVEVNPSVNIYLPPERMNYVPGTWAILPSRHRDVAAALMFVYPRDGGLVRRYIDEILSSSSSISDNDDCGSRDNGYDDDEEEEEEEEDNNESESTNEKGNGKGGNICSNAGSSLITHPHVFWLGPKCDWEDTGFASLSMSLNARVRGYEVLELRDGGGLAEYEMLAVLRPVKQG